VNNHETSDNRSRGADIEEAAFEAAQEMHGSIPREAAATGNDEATTLPLGYAQERFVHAIHILATTADIKRGLAAAFLEIQIIPKDVLPEEVRRDFEWVVNKMTSKTPHYPDQVPVPSKIGSISASVRGMHRTTAEQIAKRICLIEAIVCD